MFYSLRTALCHALEVPTWTVINILLLSHNAVRVGDCGENT
jgi:hypothetical protein